MFLVTLGTKFLSKAEAHSALTAEEFESFVWAEHQDAVFFADKDGWVGEPGSDAPIIEQNQLEKEPGDKITIPFRRNLTGAGKFGDKLLWDFEEALNFMYANIYINQIRHATKDEGRMTRKRPAFDLDMQHAKALGKWFADVRDTMVFDTSYRALPAHISAATGDGGLGLAERWHPNWFVPGSATLKGFGANPANEAAITTEEDLLTDDAGDKASIGLLDDIATEVLVQNLMPITIDGDERFIVICHPFQMRQLRRDSEWTAAVREAMERGKTNPMFRRAKLLWNNLIVYESNRVEVGSNANIRRMIVMGANALGYARAGEAFTDRKTWDYENQHRYSIGIINGWMRADYQTDEDVPTVLNQSGLIVSTYSPPVFG